MIIRQCNGRPWNDRVRYKHKSLFSIFFKYPTLADGLDVPLTKTLRVRSNVRRTTNEQVYELITITKAFVYIYIYRRRGFNQCLSELTCSLRRTLGARLPGQPHNLVTAFDTYWTTKQRQTGYKQTDENRTIVAQPPPHRLAELSLRFHRVYRPRPNTYVIYMV